MHTAWKREEQELLSLGLLHPCNISSSSSTGTGAGAKFITRSARRHNGEKEEAL